MGKVWERVPATFPERTTLALDDCVAYLVEKGELFRLVALIGSWFLVPGSGTPVGF